MSECHLIQMNLMTYLRSVNTSIIGVFCCCFFLAMGHLILDHLTPIIQKMILKKNTFGPLFRKTNQNALECTTVHCNVTLQLLTPDGSNMTHKAPG